MNKTRNLKRCKRIAAELGVHTDCVMKVMRWIAQQQKLKKSQRIKNTITHRKGMTYSYKGNKWGRPRMDNTTRNKVLELHDRGIAYNEICRQVTYMDKNNQPRNISKAMVSRIVTGANNHE